MDHGWCSSYIYKSDTNSYKNPDSLILTRFGMVCLEERFLKLCTRMTIDS
jgi:hypothetical protein